MGAARVGICQKRPGAGLETGDCEGGADVVAVDECCRIPVSSDTMGDDAVVCAIVSAGGCGDLSRNDMGSEIIAVDSAGLFYGGACAVFGIGTLSGAADAGGLSLCGSGNFLVVKRDWGQTFPSLSSLGNGRGALCGSAQGFIDHVA